MPNPKQARNFAKVIAQRNKSNVIDARVLSEALIIAKSQEIFILTINPIVENNFVLICSRFKGCGEGAYVST